MILSSIIWDPDPNLFVLPYLDHPLKWYGLFFMGGIVAGFFIFLRLFKEKLRFTRKLQEKDIKELSYKYVDGLLWWIVIGTIIGARLGHVFFYGWTYYQQHPASILKIWEGGLASHGGTVGVLLAILFYTYWTKKKYPEINCLALTDLLAIPAPLAATFIRLGNFMNQEILGTASSLPWAVVFGHPIDGGPAISRHPVQLYEATAYLITFILLTTFWKLKKRIWAEGFMTGLFFVCVFGARFLLEFFKAPQESSFNGGFLQIGQILSLPFIFLGIALIFFSQFRRKYGFRGRQPQH